PYGQPQSPPPQYQQPQYQQPQYQPPQYQPPQYPQAGGLPTTDGFTPTAAKKSAKGKRAAIVGASLLVLGGIGAGAVYAAKQLVAFDAAEGGDWAVRLQSNTPSGSITASGVMVGTDGYVATTADAVLGADEIKAFLGGAANSFPAEVVGVSECSNIALLRFNGRLSEYDARPWSSGQSATGDVVYAAGFAAGGEAYSVAEGAVTDVHAEWVGHTAPIADGFAGSALVSEDGDVVGINLSSGTAVPSDVAQRVKIGSSDDIGFVGSASADGLVIHGVAADSPAAAAGLRSGDVIVTALGTTFGVDAGMDAYCGAVAGKTDQPVPVTVVRNGAELVGEFGGAPLAGLDASVTYQTAVDDSGALRFDVPVDWTVDGRPTDEFPDLYAEGDEGYANMYFLVLDDPIEAQVTLTLDAWECTAVGEASPWDDGVYFGLIQQYTCDNGYDSILVIAEDETNERVLVDIGLTDSPRSAQIAETILSTFAAN
ncbi:MAG: serine protease, partial [Acidimicrobiales bacterium]